MKFRMFSIHGEMLLTMFCTGSQTDMGILDCEVEKSQVLYVLWIIFYVVDSSVFKTNKTPQNNHKKPKSTKPNTNRLQNKAYACTQSISDREILLQAQC